MLWKITCYNGTVWESKYGEHLIDALKQFMFKTGLHVMDIKLIENKT